MQETWQRDENKCTFILLDKEEEGEKGKGKMCGDVNLFFHEYDNESAGEGGERQVGEIEVMVAEPNSRRKGIASEAIRMMIHYSATTFATKKYVAKIKQHNFESLALFTKIGFTETSRSQVFQEVVLTLEVGENLKRITEIEELETSKYE